jgi:hypothetical protein
MEAEAAKNSYVMYFKAVKLAEHLFRLLAESKMLEVKV